ncbi:MAG: enoyl-CoA hydratase/isomerase family protein [Acidimicrobiales bacterium]
MSYISLEVADRVGTITIDRPEKKNAITYAMLGELGRAFEAATNDDEVRAIVFTGVPGSFCAGTDLSDLDATPEDERANGGLGRHAFMDCPKPVVAAIDGAAVGMGVEFASMCDVRVASDRARFGWVFVHRGLVPDTGAGTWLLPRLVGVEQAARLVFSGDIVDAAEAARIGFVSEVSSSESVVERATAVARRFAEGSPFAVQETKRLLYDGIGRDWAAHVHANRAVMARCFASDDHREGVASFLERRPARFTGR